MEIALKRRDIANRIDITHSFRQNRVNGRIFRTDLYVSTLKLACIAFGVLKAMETAFKRRNITNRTDITHSFLRNRVNCGILDTVKLVSTLVSRKIRKKFKGKKKTLLFPRLYTSEL